MTKYANERSFDYADDDYSNEAIIWREAQRINNKHLKVDAERSKKKRREDIEDEVYSR